jgi:hypothetical protein
VVEVEKVEFDEGLTAYVIEGGGGGGSGGLHVLLE